MVPDGMGFRYPRVDMDRCVDCHRCEDVCAFDAQEIPRTSRGMTGASCPANAGHLMAEAIRFPALMDRSQSGGLAFALMRKAVRGGMVV